MSDRFQVSYQLRCPNCGIREVTDFGFGGEISPRPRQHPTFRELNTYNYFRRNVAGVQREWWYHRSGCRAWFVAERDTRTNDVQWTALPGQEPAGTAGQAPAGQEPAGHAPAGHAAAGQEPAGHESAGPMSGPEPSP